MEALVYYQSKVKAQIDRSQLHKHSRIRFSISAYTNTLLAGSVFFTLTGTVTKLIAKVLFLQIKLTRLSSRKVCQTRYVDLTWRSKSDICHPTTAQPQCESSLSHPSILWSCLLKYIYIIIVFKKRGLLEHWLLQVEGPVLWAITN
jgi:hypothetical protein